MARLRITFITTAALIALAAFQLSSLAQQQPAGAQQPGGGRGGPGGGRGGPGGGFGFGGPGGGFNSLLGLASNPGVQGELKVTDKQKTAIKGLTDKYEARNRELRTEAGFGGPGGPGGFFGGGGPGGGGPGGGGNGGPGGGRGNRGGGGGQAGGNADDAAQGGGGGQGGGGQGGGGQGGGGQGGRGGRGNRPNLTPEQQEKMQEFRDATTQLRLTAEQSLGKILDKKQVVRLKQIQLQLDPQGPWIVLRDDMVEKLNLSEEQVEMLRELRDGQRQKERELRKTNRETMDAVMKKASPDFVGFNRGGNRGNRGNNGNAGNNGGGQNGNQGNRQQFDPAAFQKAREEMQKIMEMPEVKDAREKQRDSEKVIENESYALITKNLYPRQRATLKSMVGPPLTARSWVRAVRSEADSEAAPPGRTLLRVPRRLLRNRIPGMRTRQRRPPRPPSRSRQQRKRRLLRRLRGEKLFASFETARTTSELNSRPSGSFRVARGRTII